MSLHKKVAFRIFSLKSQLIQMRGITRDKEHRVALEMLIDDIMTVLAKAEHLLAPKDNDGEIKPEDARNYPFAGMEMGDTFEVPLERAPSLRSCACAYGKRHGKKFVVRLQPGSDTVRCYRIE